MRTYGIYVALALVLLPAPALAGESLVNGSFEDGTLNGWTIVSDSLGNYHDPPVTQCICGGEIVPEDPGAHKDHDLLYAADGQYFAGLSWIHDEEPYHYPHPGDESRYFQTIDVANWDAGADRTNYDFEIWSQMAHSWDWDRHGQAKQMYIIHWNDDGLAPHDTALVVLSGNVADGDTIEIDTGGVNRVYEFDLGDGIRPSSDVAAVVAGPVTATVTIVGGVVDGDTIELDTAGVNRVYEFDVDSSVGGGNVLVDVSAGVGKANAKTALVAAVNGDGLAPCTAADSGGNVVTLTWTGGAGGDGAVNTNLNDANGTIAVTNFGRDKAIAKSALTTAINGDPALPPYTAADGGTDKITLTWTGAPNYGATNTNLNDANSGISVTDFITLGKINAKAALIAAINADAAEAPCSASSVDSYSSKRYIRLTWDTLSSGGATNSNLNDAYGTISVTDFSYFTAECDNEFRIGYLDCMAFVTGSELNFNNWRQIKLAGSIPDNPQAVVLEIQLDHEGNMSTSHNFFDGVVFSVESATGSSIGPFAGDAGIEWDPEGDPRGTLLGQNSDFEEPPYNTQYMGWENVNSTNPFGWDLLGRFDLEPDLSPNTGPIEGLTHPGTEPPPLPHDTNPMDMTTSDGTHFWGRANDPPTTEAHNCEGHWGHIIPVRNWSPCAVGIRWKLHYLTQIWNTHDMLDPDWPSSYSLYLWWDLDVDEPGNSIFDIPADPSRHYLKHGTSPWFKIVDMSDRAYPDCTTRGMIEVEQVGEFAPTDRYGTPYAPEYVLLRDEQWVWGWFDARYPFRIAYDKVDFYIEAILPDGPFIRDGSPLPEGSCQELYSVKLSGCGAEPLTFSLVSGSLPPGFRLSADGQITGQPGVAGTYVFTIQLEDATLATSTKEFELTIADSTACCGEIPADFDHDEDVDQEDFSFLQICMTGVEGGILLPPDHPDCTCADLDHDGLDVDQADFFKFESCASGPEVPADPSCDKEACCLPDGGCADADPALCDNAGGVAQGAGTDCDTTVCEASQACCMSDGSCQDLIESECLAASGYPQGAGTDCLSTSCPQQQGCCLDGGDCQMLVPLDCTALGGVPRGEAVDCSEECTEACCYSGGLCFDYHPDTCLPYGTPQGPGTDCDPNPCP